METLVNPEPWRDREILLERSARHYIRLPFHNGQHRIDVPEEAVYLADLYIANGGDPEEIDYDVLESAGYYHDARVYLPISWHGFRSKEEFSAFIYIMDMRELGMPEDKINKGVRLIEITERGTHCKTVLERIFRRADLKNVSAKNPLEMVANTLALNNEAGILALLEEIMSDPSFKDLTDAEKLELIYDNPVEYDFRKSRPNLKKFGQGSSELLHDLVDEDLSVPGCPDFNTPCFRNLLWLTPHKLVKAVKLISQKPNQAA